MLLHSLVLLLLIAPLAGFIINALRWKSSNILFSGTLSSLMVGVSFLSSIFLLWNFSNRSVEDRIFHLKLFDWIGLTENAFHVQAGLTVDPLSLLMVLVITGVGLLIHIFSISYMSSDSRPSKYFCYLNLFVFNMLLLVLGDNLLLMFVGWEGVGLCSYLLIGFWFSDQSKAAAGMKAFITNRIGDAGFLLGIFFLFQTFQTIHFSELALRVPETPELGFGPITLACLFLFIGAIGKSAQIPLFVWLPDAMAGPTPVSALIHAATMVTAGVYMIVRMHFLFLLSPFVMQSIATLGVLTAFMGASIAITQWDIKKIFAYSTVSQLGYMFLGVGVGAFVPAMFHLVTHAFFKALLFLGAGSLIFSQNHEQDIRNMGGLRKKMPLTYACFICGWFALCGLPPFAGFFSKDEILWKSLQSPLGNPFFWIIGFITAAFTGFYITRAMAWVFWKPYTGEKKRTLTKTPLFISIPLIFLAFLSTVGGLIGIPHLFSKLIPGHPPHILDSWLSPFIKSVEMKGHSSTALEITLMSLTVGVVCFSLWLAYDFYILHPERSKKMFQYFKKIHLIFSKKYYVNDLYLQKIVQPTLNISRGISQSIDVKFIDRITHWLSHFILSCARSLSLLQRGNVQEYALYVVLGIVLGIFLLM